VRNGNCKTILEDIQQTFWLDISTELLYLRDYDITHCDGCYSCRSTEDHVCVKGDKAHIVVDKMLDSEIVIFASPNYFYNISGLAKNFIDKTLPYYPEQILKGKKIIFVYTGMASADTTKACLDNAMRGFAKCHGMEILGSFAYQTPDLGVFADERAKASTTQEICNLIRSTLSNID